MKQKLSAFMIAGILIAAGWFGNSTVRAVGTDNFSISNFDIKMDLDRDESGHSVLRTTETITADFPSSDQNHYLNRTLIKKYDGHKTDFELISVTDGNGRALAYHWDDDVLQIGDKDIFVHGIQTYKITYSQRDVTREYADTGSDEFYWDVIGTEWRVPIDQVSIAINISTGLRGRVQGDPRCYVGYQRGSDICQINQFDGTYMLSVSGIGIGRGATVAFGFMPQTFIGYQATLVERLFELFIKWLIVANLVIGPIVLVIGGALLVLRYRRAKRRYRKIVGETVVPEYLPPRNRVISESARVWSSNFFSGAWTGRMVSAQLMEWAVAHYADFRETKSKTFFRPAQYTITFKKSLADLPELDRKMAKLIIGEAPAAGDSITTDQIRKRSKTIYRQIRSLGGGITKGDLYEKALSFERWATRLAIICVIVGIFIFSAPVIILAIIAWALQRQVFVSQAGEKLYRHLEGLKMYIGADEEERLKILQSPDDVPGIANDQTMLVKLHERLLPYAILFGQEKEWTRQLGKLYEDSQVSPSWVAGNSTYGAAEVAGFMNGFSSTVTSTSSYGSKSGSRVGRGSGGGR